ncbi:hypothetical protein ACSVH2_07220 [Flavobacterium sp. RSB2_4_14]|uniref:hypothetical protein n=1 Tax=Flavobacterium sp. RSB2_4_14 TaxID=3447665 RepID=UPI003F2A919B
MKSDITVKRAKEVINILGLVAKIEYLKEYKNIVQLERYSENYVKKRILYLAENENEMNYLFVNKVLKQIDLMLL